MGPLSEHVVLEPEPPATARAGQVLRSYMDDVVSRYHGRQATDYEIDAAIREAPSNDLTPPQGLFLVAEADATVVGCAGLRFRPGRIGEVTRLFVVPAARRRGFGSLLMSELETRAREHGLTALRLDTREGLIEARLLYARCGYREVAPFNDGPYADHWFGKTLT